MVSSHVYPGLERKPGGPDNWVEATGGLPSYIERIAKHLHYERGFSISRAIATAVNTVKRWAKGGTVTKNGTTKRITPKTQALAAAAVAEWEAKRGAARVNLAEPDISDTQTMVCLLIGQPVAGDIAIPGGVEAKDLHITLTFNGEVDDSEGYDTLVGLVRECAADYGELLKGSIGGIGAFPAGDQGTPWLALVDIPGLSEFRYHLVEALQGSDHPANVEHGYVPHVTLSYDDQPDPLPATPVEFSSVWVVRGNDQRTEIPLGSGDSQAGAPKAQDGTISPTVGVAKEGKMELSAMLERARAISDPEQKARVRASILELAVSAQKRNASAAAGHTITGTKSFPIDNEQDLRNAIQAYGRAKNPDAAKKHIIARARSLGLTRLIPKQWKIDLASAILSNVIDLALTKDGRQSFKKQGKWGHGFVPLDEKAKQAKAKGSPIAMRRINRLFAGATKGVTVKGEGGGTVHATSAARLGGAAQAKDATSSQRVKVGAKKEASKGGGVTQRAKQDWDQIADDQKTIRNGKKYVVAIFGGKQQLTEWVGPSPAEDVKADPATVKYASMTPGTAAKFSTGQLRRLLAVPGQPDSVKKVLNAALRKAQAEAGNRPVGAGV